MPVICAVADCENTKQKTPDKVFHIFPIRNKEICNQWINSCKRKYPFNPVTSRICSDHFEASNYQRDLENELLGLPVRKRLKSDAAPTIFPARINERSSDSSRALRHNNRSWKIEKRDIVESVLGAQRIPLDDQENRRGTGEVGVQVSFQLPTQARSQNDFRKLIDKQRELLRRKKNEILQLRRQLKEAKLTILRLKKVSKRSSTHVSMLSQSQHKFLQGQRRVNWSRTDIVKALSVRSVGLKAYETARRYWGIPLPTVRTLRNWTRNFNCSPGILADVIDIMKSEATSITLVNRICVLSFDEISISSAVVLDPSDLMLKSGSKAQVVMARGICDGWKQPIYYDFDQPMTQDILFKIIKSLEESGYPVHAIVSDLGGDNRSLWNQLKIDITHNSFPNPSSNRNVYVFADVPHMLKLLRNHLLDDGIVLPCGTRIDKSTFEYLIEKDNTEIKRCPKLSAKLVNVSGPSRMRVRPAAQLLSRHVACLASVELQDKPKISEFISVVNEGFDVLNSRIPNDANNYLKSGYGCHFLEQNEKLEQLREIMLSSRFLTKLGNQKKVLLPFQKGFVISINSTQALLKDLSKTYGIKYLLTSRLNQDGLESLFSQIRAYGGPNTSPTVCEFKYRLRLLLVGSKVRSPQGMNVESDLDEFSWISSKLILKNKLTKGYSPSAVVSRKIKYNCNQEALEYLGGYIAFKLKQEGFDFGAPTSHLSGSSWIHILSQGGLIVPNRDFMGWIKDCNSIFETLFNQKSSEPLMKRFKETCAKFHSHIPERVINAFFGVRVKIRAKYLNQNELRSFTNARKLKQFVKSR